MHERAVPGACDPQEMQRFLASFMYREPAFFVDEVIRLDREARCIEARMRTDRALPLSDLQRTHAGHPPHVAAAELLQATGSLGFMHAWFFYGCRWDEGWSGFGNRIHRADFRKLVRRGPDLELCSRETRSRAGPRRVMLRCEFEFRQGGALVYFGDQSAIFVKDRSFEP